LAGENAKQNTVGDRQQRTRTFGAVYLPVAGVVGAGRLFLLYTLIHVAHVSSLAL
jgi:hypothetical protein